MSYCLKGFHGPDDKTAHNGLPPRNDGNIRVGRGQKVDP